MRTFPHVGGVNSVAFSPDGTLLGTGSGRAVRLWDVASGAGLVFLNGGPRAVNDVAFAPDGKTLASARGGGKEVDVWDVATARKLRTIGGFTGRALSVAFSPDGRTLAAGGGEYNQIGQVKLFDPATGAERADLPGHTPWVEALAYSRDGRHLVSTRASLDRPGEVRLWDLADTDSRPVSRATLKAEGEVWSVAFSPDGKSLLTAGAAIAGDDRNANSGVGVVKLWDVAERRLRFSLGGYGGWILGAAFSPDGKYLAIGAPSPNLKTIWIVDAATGEDVAALEAHAGGARSVAFSPDGATLATGGADGTIKLRDFAGLVGVPGAGR